MLEFIVNFLSDTNSLTSRCNNASAAELILSPAGSVLCTSRCNIASAAELILSPRYWQKFKALASFQMLKKFVFQNRQRAMAHSWSSWRDLAVKSALMLTVQSAVHLSLVGGGFSSVMDSSSDGDWTLFISEMIARARDSRFLKSRETK